MSLTSPRGHSVPMAIKNIFVTIAGEVLFLKDKETYEFICTFCNILYYPNNQLLKKSNRFDLPGPDTDSQGNVTGNNTIPIAMIDYPNKELSSTSYKQQKLPVHMRPYESRDLSL